MGEKRAKARGRIDLPDGVDALVLPGLPGRPDPDDIDGGVYPGPTVDIVKLLREQGLVVDYIEPRESRQTLELKSAEIWVPVLLFAYAAAANGAGTLLAHAIIQLFGRTKPSQGILHVKCGYTSPDGETEWFDGHGHADDVLDALRSWRTEDH